MTSNYPSDLGHWERINDFASSVAGDPQKLNLPVILQDVCRALIDLHGALNTVSAPVVRDPMDENDKSPRVDVDDDLVVWDEVKQGWRFWQPGDENFSTRATLEGYSRAWASIKGFATPEQVREFGLDA